MAILYALVARGSTVLAEFDAAHGNAKTIARQILEKIPGTGDSHVSYSQDRYIFHVKRTDGLTVLCMADDTAGRRIPFAFLEDIHGKFVKTYGRAVHTALAFTMNDEFSRVLSQQMEYYSSDPNADKINRIRGEMSQVRNVMVENIDKVLERGDRLELLVDKTETIQGNTFKFKKQARRFKNTLWWRNIKLTFMTSPKVDHWTAAKQILRYVKGTLDFGILYNRSKDPQLCGYTDSNWEGSVDDRKSTSGYVFSLGTGSSHMD